MSQETHYTGDGTPYDGEVADSGRGFLFGSGMVRCPSCAAGSGRRTCRRCGGSKKVYDQFKVYTEEQFARLTASREKRKLAKQGEEIRRQEAIREGHLDYVSTHRELVEKAAAERDNPFLRDLLEKSEKYGGLTDAQTEAMRSVVTSLEDARKRHAASVPLGAPGDAVEAELECLSCRTVQKPNFRRTDMEDLHVSEFTDPEGNAVVVLSNRLRFEKGERFRISGVVKEVDNARGFVRTRLGAVTVLEHSPGGPTP